MFPSVEMLFGPNMPQRVNSPITAFHVISLLGRLFVSNDCFSLAHESSRNRYIQRTIFSRPFRVAVLDLISHFFPGA